MRYKNNAGYWSSRLPAAATSQTVGNFTKDNFKGKAVNSRGQFTHGLSDRPNEIMYCIPRGQFAHGLEDKPNEKENNLLEERS